MFVVVLVNLPPVQTWLVSQVAESFSKKLNTKVSIKKIDISFFNKLLLRDLLIEDQSKDTLVFAGTAKLSITDWFIFKDKAEIKYLGLDDAIVKMNRTDSVWNYQFLIDYFDTPSTGKTKKQIEFNLKEAHFKNINFIKNDAWIGQNMQVSLKALDLSMQGVDYKNKSIAINNLTLDQPKFSQSDYIGKRPPQSDLSSILNKIPVVSAFKWNNSGWTISVGKIAVKDGRFLNDKETPEPAIAAHFDGLHIDFSSINGSINNLIMQNDTLRGFVNLSAKERSGLIVKELSSNMKFTPDIMEFSNLVLATNKSRLTDYYSMSFKSFNKDMRKFISDVTLKANFKNSYLHSDDLAFFAPPLKAWNREFKLNGEAQGTIENFSIKKMIVETGGAYVDGDLAMRGLPNIKSTFIDFTSRSLRSSYTELSHIIPQLKKINTPDIKALGNINFSGNFTGFLDDFVTYGTLRSNLGTIKADLNMKLPEGGIPAYSGVLSSEKFNIGKFLKNNSLGLISLNGTVDGKGFDIKTINTNFKGTVHSIDFANKNFTNIDITGDFTKKKFNGHFNIDDPKLKINDLDGMLDFSGEDMIINAVADVEYADLKQLGISKNNIGLKGSLNVNFEGNNIDDFLGTASIYNAALQTDATTLMVDSLILSSLKINDKKILRLHSSELDAEIEGNFSIVDLPNSFKFFLSRYYPAYIGKPTYAVSNQDFIFNVRTKNIDKFLPLLDSRIDGLNNSTISGSLNLIKSELVLHANVPTFSYEKKEFSNIILNAEGNIDTLKADFAIDNIRISDSLSFPDTRINISANNNLSFINIKTSAAKTLNDAELNVSILTMNDGVKINFFPSSFIINGKNL